MNKVESIIGKGANVMNNFTQIAVIVFVIIYAISPIDAFPGPIDDFIVSIMGYAMQKKLGSV